MGREEGTRARCGEWVARGASDSLAALQMLAGDGEGAVRRLLDDVRDAKHWLDGCADLTTATKYFSMNGPMSIERVTAAELTRFLDEDKTAPKPPRDTFTTELSASANFLLWR